MDVDTCFQEAKEKLVEAGTMWPMLYVELAEPEELHLFMLEALNDNLTIPEQEGVLFGMGRRHGMEHQGSKLRSVTFASEVWASSLYPIDPKLDTKRREVLVAEGWNRDQAGITRIEQPFRSNFKKKEVVFLQERKKTTGGSVSRQLASFVNGFRSRIYSEEELMQAMREAALKAFRHK